MKKIPPPKKEKNKIKIKTKKKFCDILQISLLTSSVTLIKRFFRGGGETIIQVNPYHKSPFCRI